MESACNTEERNTLIRKEFFEGISHQIFEKRVDASLQRI